MPVPFSLPPLGNVRAAARFVCSGLAPRHGFAMRYRPCRPMPAPTRRGPASPMRGFLAKPRIPLRSRCALRSMPPYGSASLRAPLTIPRARGADDLASRTWNARFTFVRTKPLRDVARTNHLAPGGVLADYRATRRVGSAALFSPTHFGERKGLEGLIPQGLWFAAIVGPIASARVVRRGPSVALPGMSLLHRLRRETACLLQRRFVVYRRRGSSWALFADCG